MRMNELCDALRWLFDPVGLAGGLQSIKFRSLLFTSNFDNNEETIFGDVCGTLEKVSMSGLE